MKRQNDVYPKVMSAKLDRFLKGVKKKKYDRFGFSDFVQKFSAEQVWWQTLSLERDRPEILVDTAMCQPFLFWNDRGELDIAGVTDYDSETQTGSLKLRTASGILNLTQVHSYHVFVKIGDKYLPTNSRYIPEHHELIDVYVSAIILESGIFTLSIYHNTQLIYSLTDVFECEFYQHKEKAKYINRKGYVRFSKKRDNGIYSNYLYDINSETLFNLQDSDCMPSCYLPSLHSSYSPTAFYKNIDNYLYDYIRGPWIKVVVHLNESKTSQIIAEFIKKAEQYSVITNTFPDDPTVNVEFLYRSYSSDLRFLYYCYQKDPSLFGHGIMGLTIDEIEIGTKNNPYEHHYVYDYSPHYIEHCIYINQHLFTRCNEQMALNRLPFEIYRRHISSDNMGLILQRNITHNFKETKSAFPKEDFSEEAKLYNKIAAELAKSGKLKTRWKNEYELYKIVSDRFPDAVYQYHCHWLGYQSLDVYVPSQNMGFEYQGRQHYEAVSFFGGEERLQMQIERDQRKRQLCLSNGVKIIEWRYDEPVSSLVLERKLNSLYG